MVEICVTRVLSCIRETKTAERYCAALVDLLRTCLLWNLQPSGTTKEEPPHAKIAADIISSIFLVRQASFLSNKYNFNNYFLFYFN